MSATNRLPLPAFADDVTRLRNQHDYENQQRKFDECLERFKRNNPPGSNAPRSAPSSSSYSAPVPGGPSAGETAAAIGGIVGALVNRGVKKNAAYR